MEFVSEEEAKEYGCENISFTEYGVEGIDTVHEYEQYKKESADYYVRAFVSGNFLYVAKKGITYEKSLAKSFSKSDAEKKALYMKRNGTYDWIAVKKN